jgi:hypothetical protein
MALTEEHPCQHERAADGGDGAERLAEQRHGQRQRRQRLGT